MTQSKFEIGSQWRTRGGWRAVVVGYDREERSAIIWHENNDCTYCHFETGQICTVDGGGDNLDLIELWIEPREFEVWVDVCEYAQDDVEIRAHRAQLGKPKNLIARKKITIREGEGIKDAPFLAETKEGIDD